MTDTFEENYHEEVPAVDNGNDNDNNKPGWVAKTARPYGRHSRLERIGVAWDRRDGGIGINFVGTQIIDGPVYLYKIEEPKF